MPQFTTISPTHVPGKKESAWRQFLEGGYVAIGWLRDANLTEKPFNEIERLIREQGYPNEASAIDSFRKLLALEPGDYVAANNANHGLFGVGVIRSDYKFQPGKHNTGDESDENFYSHYREVEWVRTTYVARRSLVGEGETGWRPYGTVGKLYFELPPFIERLIGEAPPEEKPSCTLRPEFLDSVIRNIESLREDPEHQEQTHVALVEDFFVALGYDKYQDIKRQRRRVDLTLVLNDSPLAVAEVKRAWDLSRQNKHGLDAMKQAYEYALDQGIRHVIVTNGDIYLLFDRLKGLSWETNVLGEFRLTALQEGDLEIIDRLRPQRMNVSDIGEVLQHLAEGFQR